MNKQEWVEFLDKEIAILKANSSGKVQDNMINAFYVSELDRLEYWYDDEVGYKIDLLDDFNSFQHNYEYKNQVHFTRLYLSFTV